VRPAERVLAELPARVSNEELRGQVILAQQALQTASRVLRDLYESAGNGQHRADLVIALEKAEASGFWFREGVRSLQASRATVLLPE
jgi:hypothetical protein